MDHHTSDRPANFRLDKQVVATVKGLQLLTR